jgi:hypothetical protein
MESPASSEKILRQNQFSEKLDFSHRLGLTQMYAPNEAGFAPS